LRRAGKLLILLLTPRLLRRLRVGDAFDLIIDDANLDAVGLAAPLGFGGMDMAQMRAIGRDSSRSSAARSS
jgi:hypothetical protein